MRGIFLNSMENSVKERLILFIKEADLSVSKFERMCHLSNGYVNSIVNSISEKKIKCISEVFPNLNINWLLTGEGDMIQGQSAISINHMNRSIAAVNPSGDIKLGIDSPQQKTIDALLNELAAQRQQTEKVLDQYEHLLSIIERMTTK